MTDVAAPRPDGPFIDLRIGPYMVAAATAYGPRIVSLRREDGPEMLARLDDDVVIEHPDSGIYRPRGGHRLWAAPEVPQVTAAGDELQITAPVDGAGLVKRLQVSPGGETLVVNHDLTNAGAETISIAPWGITQFRLGGVALVPTGPLSDDFQADRSLVLWPYTNLADPRLSILEGAALIDAVAGRRLKLGSGPSPGRLGYLIESYLFTKQVPSVGTGEYPDRGALGQVYVDNVFCELESIGPMSTLPPGASVSHREVWEVTRCPDPGTAHRGVMHRGTA